MSRRSQKSHTVLVVEDDQQALSSLMGLIRVRAASVRTVAAGDPNSARSLFNEYRPDVIFLDLVLLDGGTVEDGFELLNYFLERDPAVRVMVLTGNHSVKHGIRALQRGAAAFLEKPADSTRLIALLEDAFYQAHLRRQVVEHDDQKALDLSEVVIGPSSAMEAVRESIRYAGRTDQSVLIVGETGVGKGICARAIHSVSQRSELPFVSYQPVVATPEFAGSTLFGHRRGAYTGAIEDRDGLIKQAQGGTLFLDEVNSFPLGLQVALLGVVQDRIYRALGSDFEVNSDFRLISATNQDLEESLSTGSIRKDFYYRISGHVIVIPPLRDRLEDIPALVKRFLTGGIGIDEEALSALADYDWPGNVRELISVVERARYGVALSDRQMIERDDISIVAAQQAPRSDSFNDRVDAYRYRLVSEAVAKHNGISKAAEELGIDRGTIRRILKTNTRL